MMSQRVLLRLTRRFALLPVCLWALTGGQRVQADEGGPQPEYQLAAAGNDQILWLIVGTWESEQHQFIQRLAYLDATSNRARAPQQIDPQKGRLRCWAAIDESLYLFFGNGAHYSYTRSRARAERQLPHRAVPKAIAGEVPGSQPRLWAVVEAKTANAVEQDWQERLSRQATKPAEYEPSSGDVRLAPLPDDPRIDRPEGTCHLVQYDGASWRPGFPAPSQCGPGDRFWLCVSADGCHVFWQRNARGSAIHCSRYESDRWVTQPPVRLSQPPWVGVDPNRQDHFAGMVNGELLFVALVQDANDPQRVQCESWFWPPGAGDTDPGEWRQRPPAKTKDQGDLTLPAASAIGAFKDKLVLMRMGEEKAQFGLWPTTGGPPDQPFSEVPLRQTDGGSPTHRGIRDFAAVLIVAAMLLLVFWRRQESIGLPIALPAGLEVAGPGKRALAAAADLAPAAAFVVWRWYDPISTMIEDIRLAAQASQELENFATPGELVWAWVWFRLIYTGYCTVFEVLLATTPGKRLLGCQILTETLVPPNAVQIAIRNIIRLVELEPYLQIWPFMLVIFLTRNRQRMGDLLARTIVVRRQATLLEADESPDEREND